MRNDYQFGNLAGLEVIGYIAQPLRQLAVPRFAVRLEYSGDVSHQSGS